jgi:hypothetical protein
MTPEESMNLNMRQFWRFHPMQYGDERYETAGDLDKEYSVRKLFSDGSQIKLIGADDDDDVSTNDYESETPHYHVYGDSVSYPDRDVDSIIRYSDRGSSRQVKISIPTEEQIPNPIARQAEIERKGRRADLVAKIMKDKIEQHGDVAVGPNGEKLGRRESKWGRIDRWGDDD